jgi:hypothetical protein
MNKSVPFHSSRSDDFSRSRQIVHIDLRAFNARRVKEMSNRGDALIQVLAASDQDCPVCTGLDGQIFSANELPAIPPENCTCLPYCTCVLTVISKDNSGPSD